MLLRMHKRTISRTLHSPSLCALAVEMQAVQRQDDTAHSERHVLLLESLQAHIPGHQAECEFWPVCKDFSQARQLTQSFDVDVYDASSACAYLDVIFSACADFRTGVSCFKRS